MQENIVTNLLIFYGVFLITSGIVATLFIGMKAKTALLSGGASGVLSLVIAYLNAQDITGANVAGMVLPGALLIVFSWRSTKTLFKLFELIASQHEDLKGKGIAFLIISLMAVMSLVVLMLQVVVRL